MPEIEMSDELKTQMMVDRASSWIKEAYAYPMNIKAQRRCLENAVVSLKYVIELMKHIEQY